ncbi:hypothetical protein GSI_03605 [Ganoderma sinense ZZ0214-1]|uniref:Uncharacterized protein n=1 Tax=Ganoderma sinense ZZ0214-1 TaxID=1077348 RepID=A0A2G8SJF3_9APHY|nr:hypothetical protein GSI_03605 [Ganoderma sinense ZZ0214-1]
MSGSSSTTSTATALAPSPRTGRSYDAHLFRPIPREVAPGIMDDGTLSAAHPLVHQFLAYTARKFQRLETDARAHTRRAAIFASAATAAKRWSKNTSKNNNKAKPKTKTAAQKERERARERAEVEAAVEHWHGQHKHPRVTRWRCMRGGVARVADVHDALGPGVTDRLAAAIFALAALSVYNSWTDPAHWAFWAVNIVEDTASAVHGVVRADPREITVPDHVAWVDAEMAVNVLRVWHGGFVPHQPKKSEAASDEEKDSDSDDGETSVKNANGKRTASDDRPATPTKRTRTKEPQNLAPTRQSARISMRKATQVEPAEREEMVVDVVECAAEPVASVELEAESEPVDAEPEDTVVAEPASAAYLEAEPDSQAQESQVAPSAKKSRSRPSRPRKSTGGRKPRAPRKPRASAGDRDIPSEPSLPAAPSPSSSSSCTIRIPARSSAGPVPALRELLDEVLSSPPQVISPLQATSGETTAAGSRESTAVGTPSSGLSTRVGTPLLEVEVKVKPIVVKPKVVPVRTSARIRAKSSASPV